VIVVVMGVSGSGKTVVGQALAKDLGWPFFDADNFHPKENVAKMAAGTPLTDADRGGHRELHDAICGRYRQRAGRCVVRVNRAAQPQGRRCRSRGWRRVGRSCLDDQRCPGSGPGEPATTGNHDCRQQQDEESFPHDGPFLLSDD